MAHDPKIIKKARKFRQRGFSITVIARELGISKSTASLWVRDVALPKEICDKLRHKSEKGCELGRSVMAARREVMKEKMARDAGQALKRFVDAKNRDFWRFTAAMLFWCEGGKRRLSCLEFSNSDPALIAVFIKSLKLGFGVQMDKFHVQLHLHEYHEVNEQIDFWSEITGISKDKFYKPYIKPNTGKRKHVDYPGCALVRYSSASLAQNLDVIYHLFAKQHTGA